MASGPKRHHYLSRFLLRRFSSGPEAKNPLIWKLEKRTGRPSKTAVDNEAVVRNFYRLDAMPNVEATQVEKDLGMIEGIAARHVEKLRAGKGLTEVERTEAATYFLLQHRRTPRGRQWMVEMLEHQAKLLQGNGR